MGPQRAGPQADVGWGHGSPPVLTESLQGVPGADPGPQEADVTAGGTQGTALQRGHVMSSPRGHAQGP